MVGLFTASWDLFMRIPVGTYNLKLPVIAFCASLALSVLDRQRSAAPDRRRTALLGALVFLCVAYLVGVTFAEVKMPAINQALTVLLGALVPFLAVSRAIADGGNPIRLLNAFVRGAVVASLFGFYQITAFYTKLPDPIPYEGLGGNVGRIASFSYEPAYFGYFLVLALGAHFARGALLERAQGYATPIVLLGALVLSNSRAVVFTLPLWIALMVYRARGNPLRRYLPVIGALVVYLSVIASVGSSSLRAFISLRISSIVDTQDVASNGPRLETYAALLRLARDNWVTGVGPGNLFSAGPWYGLLVPPTGTPNSVIANNIWLQAASDGGVLLVAAHVLVIVTAIACLFRLQHAASRALVAGWLSVLLVGGMLTSYFYDLKLWAVLGLAFGLARLSGVGSTDADAAASDDPPRGSITRDKDDVGHGSTVPAVSVAPSDVRRSPARRRQPRIGPRGMAAQGSVLGAPPRLR
jgi:hypothetical protein